MKKWILFNLDKKAIRDFIIRTWKRIFSRAKDTFERNKLAVILVAVISLIMVLFEFLSYRNFSFPMLDLGMYNRHMWGLVRFDFDFNPLKGLNTFNLLGDHSHYILLLLAPFYALFQSPLFLLFVQGITIGLSGYPIYLIAKKFFSDERIAVLWLVPYYFYFGLWSALGYPFHVSPLAVLPLAWALYFLFEKRYLPLLISLGFLVLIKEDMPVLIIMFGLYLIIIQRKFKLGALLIAGSALYFYFITNYLLPLIRGKPYPFFSTSFGKGFGSVFKALASQPKEVIKDIFLPIAKTKAMFYMLLSFGGLPLLGLEVLILLMPIWVGRFLFKLEEGWPYTWSMIQHHSANQGPILMVAAIVGVSHLVLLLKRYFKLRTKTFFLAATVILIAGSILATSNVEHHFYNELLRPSFYTLDSSEATAWRVVKSIPNGASVAAQSAFPQVSGRKEIYNLPFNLDKQRPDYLLMADAKGFCRWPFGTLKKLKTFKNSAVADYGYQEIVAENGIYLLKHSD